MCIISLHFDPFPLSVPVGGSAIFSNDIISVSDQGCRRDKGQLRIVVGMREKLDCTTAWNIRHLI